MNARTRASLSRNGVVFLAALLLTACGGGAGGAAGVDGASGANAGSGAGTGASGGTGSGTSAPAAPVGVMATPGDGQVALTWGVTDGATSYSVGRSTTDGGPYTAIGTPTMASYTDTAVTNDTAYFYVVSAVNSSGTSSHSAQVSVTPTKPVSTGGTGGGAGGGTGGGTGGTGASVVINIDLLTNRHYISPYVYGSNLPKDAATITDSGSTVVRWGGNATSNYNWQLGTYNSGADYYYEDFFLTPLNNTADRDSAQFIKDVKAAGSVALTTMPMLDWVAQAQGWSFPATTWASQCKFDPYNSSAGNGLQSDCKTPVTTAAQTGAYYPLLDQPGASDPPNLTVS